MMTETERQMACSKCGGPLLMELRVTRDGEEARMVPVCWSDACGYKARGVGKVLEGRYRHPLTAGGNPCQCNGGDHAV